MFFTINTFPVLLHNIYKVRVPCLFGDCLMMRKLRNSSLRFMKEEYTDEIGGRKAFTIEICTGLLNPSMVTLKISFHHWKR